MNGEAQLLSDLQVIVKQIAQRWGWCDEAAVEDICQESLLKLVQTLRGNRFRHQSSLKTYAYAIVRNTCIDHYRASRAADMIDISTLDLAGDQPGVDDHLISLDRRRVAFLVLQALPKECRQLWRTIFFGKLNYLQAGRKLGLAEGTVKRKMWECRQIARRLVDQYEK